uniref:acid phosphatase n=1 Tax=Heterorhabditis bacteriophora TaxID=37862 RepID=A0A1I7XPX8_HETBA
MCAMYLKKFHPKQNFAKLNVYSKMLLAILLLTSALYFSSAEDKELVLVQAVFRHGDRAPMFHLTSPESINYYYRGNEQLTNNGILQASKLGIVLRKRLIDSGFLDARMLPSEISFLSSASERCLMTASAVGGSIFNRTENDLPSYVPVFTQRKESDFICVPYISCPFVLEEMRETLKVKNASASLNDMLNMVIQNEAMKIGSKYWLLGNRLSVLEALILEHEAGLAVPQWLNQSALNEAYKFMQQAINFLSGTGSYHNPKWIQTRSGHLLWTILKNIRSASLNTVDKKFIAYSTVRHDVSIMGLLDSMGATEKALSPDRSPQFAACILFEVWRSGIELYVKDYHSKFYDTIQRENTGIFEWNRIALSWIFMVTSAIFLVLFLLTLSCVMMFKVPNPNEEKEVH